MRSKKVYIYYCLESLRTFLRDSLERACTGLYIHSGGYNSYNCPFKYPLYNRPYTTFNTTYFIIPKVVKGTYSFYNSSLEREKSL
ncbi:hypothetical protein CCHL11_10060 [Colletotrichum chlorophyti]|uniref:Uncharacterized protein n=1 Tax=Colletotrichum chlorophyti TaxID=708187 RepID=A0A1Q8RFI7_9PEZI|nr:hypothetical protein CCHL11_10060 [Colletotrichum chlorophyti]